MIRFLDLRQQYRQIQTEMDEAIADVVSSASFIGGPHVADFERDFADYQQAGHCVGVGNGTDALEIALEALALPPGSEVLVPANSFIASSEAVTRAGHRVVFVDVDPATYLPSVDNIRSRITARSRALVIVHLYGRPADLTALRALADKHSLALIEDSAQAHGAEHRGRRVGAIGDIGTFSFYPGKNLGAFGDAGAIVTNDEALATRCRMIANHGRTEKYVHDFEGRNSRLDALQAAVLTVKLAHLESWIKRRNQVAEAYLAGLSDVDGLSLPAPLANGDRHAYHLFVIRTSQSEALAQHLASQEVSTGRHYPVALPNQPAYAHLDAAGSTPVASAMDADLLSLPIGEHLTDSEVTRVIEAVHSFFHPR